jgi:hypothetical protein
VLNWRSEASYYCGSNPKLKIGRLEEAPEVIGRRGIIDIAYSVAAWTRPIVVSQGKRFLVSFRLTASA